MSLRKKAVSPIEDTILQGLSASQIRMSISWQHLARIMGLVSSALRQFPRT